MDLLSRAAEAIHAFMEIDAPPLLAALFWIVVAAVPLVFLHEVGHALAAQRLLGVLVEITVGSAGTLAELRLGEITARIHAFPNPLGLDGAATFDDSQASARDVLWIALAGPAASASSPCSISSR